MLPWKSHITSREGEYPCSPFLPKGSYDYMYIYCQLALTDHYPRTEWQITSDVFLFFSLGMPVPKMRTVVAWEQFGVGWGSMCG
jgi:hypothetical protein